MKQLTTSGVAVLFLLAIAGCNAMPPNDSSSRPLPPSKPGYSNQVDHWPLVFHAHWFGKACYSTYGCQVRYGHVYPGEWEDDELEISAASLGDKYPDKVLRGSWGPIRNFPPPAIVDWRSADGALHHAEIDIGEIFKDELVRHNVPREEVGKTYVPQPEIILEVSDRTISVYMRARISTKTLQRPESRYSDFRNDLIKVFSRTY